MPRRARSAVGGLVYHVLNRANGRMQLFKQDGDYHAFEKVFAQAHARTPIRILTYCVMPNHWHLVLWPSRDDELSAFMHWLSVTHAQRWHAHRRTAGTGHVYQGRFKSFPVETDAHFLTLCRYVERNPLRAGLVDRVEAWRWSGLWRRRNGSAEARSLLSAWPVEAPRNWISMLNRTEDEEQVSSVRASIKRGAPFGTPAWQMTTARRLGIEHTLHPRGRPRTVSRRD